MGGYFSSVDLEMGVRIRLREVATYRRLKLESFSREITQIEVCYLLMSGVCLREVSVSRGQTVNKCTCISFQSAY